ncbi:MAG: S41 family peptidase [Myxococcota bacterium]|nr:S41 family peptidase [Myxococcota bacterium]
MKPALFMVALLCACPPKAPPGQTNETHIQLASFDYAWQRVQDTYHDPNMEGLNWEAIRDELRPIAEQATDNESLRVVLHDLLSRLDASHFQVVPQSLYEVSHHAPALPEGAPATPPPSGTVGLELRWVEDGLRVTQVAENSPAALAGIQRGYTVLAIDGFNPQAIINNAQDLHSLPHLLARAANSALTGNPGSVVTLSLEDTEAVSLTRVESAGDVVQLGYLPPITVVFEHALLNPGSPSLIGLIRFNAFMQPAGTRFTEAMIDLIDQNIDGLVIDLRGNPGGVVAMTMGMAGHFIPEPGLSLGTMTQRHMKLTLKVIPRAPAQQFDGPVAFLIDELSASTSEVFAAGMQSLGRARVFGNTSAGMALPSIFEVLPNGDGLQFAIGDLHGPDGQRLEGMGVVPDTPITLTTSALSAGTDPIQDAAMAWILAEQQEHQ